jgi:hypothetical protein
LVYLLLEGYAVLQAAPFQIAAVVVPDLLPEVGYLGGIEGVRRFYSS